MSGPAPRSVLLAGATGLVGAECQRALLADPVFERVTVIVRRASAIDPAPAGKLQQHVVDFRRLDQYPELFAVDQIMCALGTTIRAAGSEQAFREVDYSYPLRLAQLGLAGGARHFLLVSAIGANPVSRVFYNRVKGELERDLLALGYPSTTIVRPSLLLGQRKQFRLAEEIAKRFALLIPGRFKPVQAKDVAACLVQRARTDSTGPRIISSAQMRARDCA
jgi:uncharacterized protein YbjT (DUF2867 family)